MPNSNNYLGGGKLRGTSPSVRAVREWARIQDKPTSITIYRNEVAQAVQTVRIEYEIEEAELQSNFAEASVRELYIFGVKGHPTQPDNNFKNGDLFTLNGEDYEIRDVAEYPGEIQAKAVRHT